MNLIVLAPLGAAMLRICLLRWGRHSVGNFDLLAFALSPVGLIAITCVGTLVIASLYLELAGLVQLLADERLPWWLAFAGSTRQFSRLVRLSGRQLLLCLALSVPFLAGVGIAYGTYWSGRDLNGLLILKPPEFWRGAAIAAALVGAYVCLTGWLLLRQLYAAPILIFEPEISPKAALRESECRTRGHLGILLAHFLVWAVIQFALSALMLGILHAISLALLESVPDSPTAAVVASGLILGINALVVVLLSVFSNVTFAAVWLWLYQGQSPSEIASSPAPSVTNQTPRSLGWSVGVVLFAGAIVAVGASYFSLHRLSLPETVEITAHRAGATHAPENTVAALKRAMADGADWAEIDVQLTADKALVVMHDIDLARVGGGTRRVDAATLSEIQALEIGSLFGPSFAGEHIPTLAAILTTAGNQIRLNVELKPHGKADVPELTRRVIEEIDRAGMISRCRLCSQSYESLQLARQLEPKLEVGYIVAASVGDDSQLDVDFLMVKSSLATPQFVKLARGQNRPVHAWTVNDVAEVPALLDAGVENFITDDPASIRSKIEELESLSIPERLLLRASRALRR